MKVATNYVHLLLEHRPSQFPHIPHVRRRRHDVNQSLLSRVRPSRLKLPRSI